MNRKSVEMGFSGRADVAPPTVPVSKKFASVGSALIITLTIIVLVTILGVGILSVARLERASAQSSFQNSIARVYSQIAVDQALTSIREAITAAEAPTASPDTNAHKFWASQPGKITVFNSDGSIDVTNSRTLFSISADPNSGGVDLNRFGYLGKNPIIPRGTNASAPVMTVQWINVLRDPLADAGPDNQIVGRYAYWTDDESTKVNINTADGTLKDQTNSYGAGMPSEVSLQALDKNLLAVEKVTAEEAQAIAQRSGINPVVGTVNPFNSLREMLQARVSGTPLDTNIYDANFSDLTFSSRSPDLNIFGEPKIQLLPVTPESMNGDGTTNISRNLMLGGFPDTTYSNASTTGAGNSLPLNQIYPITGTYSGNNSQLPSFRYDFDPYNSGIKTLMTLKLPQYFMQSWNHNHGYADGWPNTGDYEMGMRIALYLKGINSQGLPINWPAVLGGAANGFTGKYTDRQIDSIAVQILTMMKENYLDHYAGYNLPLVMKGFLSGEIVRGVSRAPRATEVLVEVALAAGDPPMLKMKITVEHYLPDTFKGQAINWLNTGNDYPQWNYGNWNATCYLNYQDAPGLTWNGSAVVMGAPAPTGGYWQNHMLDIRDQNGQPVGIDLYGNNPLLPDPDQAAAQKYHPYTLMLDKLPGADGEMGTADDVPNPSPYVGQYMGSGGYPGWWQSVLSIANPGGGDSWEVGDYHSSYNAEPATRYYKLKSSSAGPITSVKLLGGLALGIHNASGSAFGACNVEPVPLESLRGSLPGDAPLTPVNEALFQNGGVGALPDNQTKALLRAVIPFPLDPATGQPFEIEVGGSAVFHMQVADPLVNGFPGDWVGSGAVMANSGFTPIPNDVTIDLTGYNRGWQWSYQNGQNNVSQAKYADGADPVAAWFPPQRTDIAKSQRFPSTGYLQYIHTGMIPDAANAATTNGSITIYNGNSVFQKGTPFRLLNFSPANASSQITAGGEGFPDWAMLDFFSAPGILQPLGVGHPMNLTWGGATAGRINPNGILYPFKNADGTPLTRTKPLEALVKGVTITNYDPALEKLSSTVINDAAASTIAKGILNYIETLNRPLFLGGEICNVPEVAAYLYTKVPSNAISRNDLVRQIVGNLSPRSNTYTVWTAAQSIKKKPGNDKWGIVQDGDIIEGENRTQFVVERYMDPGSDGVYGNAANPGPDGLIGTPDDPTRSPSGTPYPEHPIFSSYPIPYKYRIAAVLPQGN